MSSGNQRMQRRSSVRQSRDSDVVAILKWLEDEERRGIPGNFLCNWPLTEKMHKEGELTVYFSPEENGPIAYQWGKLLKPGILQVKFEHRGRGIGSKLVKHLTKKARRENNDILWIECTPHSSIPFWKKMGFSIGADDVSAFQILPHTLDPPVTYKLATAEIRFYPEPIKWDEGSRVLQSHRVRGYEAEGKMWLPERIHFCPYQYEDIRDPVVEIIVNEKRFYRDKLKYLRARNFGALRCRNGWYFDCINLPNSYSMEKIKAELELLAKSLDQLNEKVHARTQNHRDAEAREDLTALYGQLKDRLEQRKHELTTKERKGELSDLELAILIPAISEVFRELRVKRGSFPSEEMSKCLAGGSSYANYYLSQVP